MSKLLVLCLKKRRRTTQCSSLNIKYKSLHNIICLKNLQEPKAKIEPCREYHILISSNVCCIQPFVFQCQHDTKKELLRFQNQRLIHKGSSFPQVLQIQEDKPDQLENIWNKLIPENESQFEQIVDQRKLSPNQLFISYNTYFKFIEFLYYSYLNIIITSLFNSLFQSNIIIYFILSLLPLHSLFASHHIVFL